MKTQTIQPVNMFMGRYSQDSNGVYWYTLSEKKNTRTKAVLLVCVACGSPYLRPPQRIKMGGNIGRFCTKTCASRSTGGHRGRKAELSHRWKGGKRESGRGYIELYCPDHPSLKGTKRKYVREHRLVMEKKLGRFLEQWEEVHHLNGVRDDNRIENLELWVKSHPAGVRMEQAIKHCPSCSCNNLN